MENKVIATSNVQDVTDYVIGAFADEPSNLNVLKLQKLLYYVQAWHLATKDAPIFDGKFQAWVHGPVNREVYDRFKDTHALYSPVNVSAISTQFERNLITNETRAHIDEIIEAYGHFTGTQLEDMTHKEKPWIEARGGRKDYERCETEIDENLMGRFYKELLEAQ